MSRLVVVLNGPNLNLLGQRQPEIYGYSTLADVEHDCHAVASEVNLELVFHQSNREYEIIYVHESRGKADGIVINPAAFAHRPVSILDALNTFEGPVIEVHIGNIHKREEFRHHSFVSLRADGVMAGFGIQGYSLAQTIVLVLKQCGDELTRENVMKQAASLKDVELPMLLPGIRLNTSAQDFFPIEDMHLARFDGTTWVLMDKTDGTH